MADRKKSSFSELALALANDYESIYVIDSSNDSYVEYTAEGAEKELVIRSRGDNFYADTIINCRKLVWPEDQDNFIKTLRKNNIEEALKKGKSLGLNYRLFIDGKPQHYFLKAIKCDFRIKRIFHLSKFSVLANYSYCHEHEPNPPCSQRVVQVLFESYLR